jgi:hypothetical protein
MTVEGGRREVALRRSEPRRLGRSYGGLQIHEGRWKAKFGKGEFEGFIAWG